MSEENNVEERKISEDSEFGGQGKKIVFRVDKDEIAKQVREELKQEENADKNVKHFQTLKAMAIEQAPVYEDQINACATPAEVMEILEAARNEKKTEKKRAPAGKSQFLPPESGGAKDYGEFLDDLYKTAYYDATVSQEERQAARAKIDSLFESLIEGNSWEQLKRSKNYHKLIDTNVESCPSCGKTLINGTTCSCGYDPYSKKHKPKTYVNPLVK